MIDPNRFSHVIGMIYDCVAKPQGWPAVLEAVTEELDGRIATLAVLDTTSRTSRFGATFGDPRIIEPLISTYSADMPFYDMVPKCPIDLPVTMADLSAMLGPDGSEIFRQSRIWTEWFVPHRIGEAMCTNIFKSPTRVGAMVINVDADRKPIAADDIDRFSLIAPHVRRAVTIGDLFEQERRGGELFRKTVDALAVAVLIIGDTLHLKYANKTAEELLSASGVGVGIVGGRVVLAEPRSRLALEQCISISRRDLTRLGSRAIGLPLPGATPLVAHVLPLGDRDHVFPFGDDAAAAVFIASPDSNAEPAIDAIAALFGLTGAERRVASQVGRGMSRSSIAETNRVSDATVKTQLDAIFDKTGTSSQRELDNLLHDLTPPLRRSH
jgi:DNA-binding CsgD family transcriptional regulator/PAS domain-containing protein